MRSSARQGIIFGVAAYALWGLLPLYFPLLKPAGPLEILASRIVWSAVVCMAVVLVLRRLGALLEVVRTPRTAGLLVVAATVVAVNWGIYVYAVNSGHVVESALGYYINPLFTILLGVLVLRERLRSWQWAAVGLGALAVAVMTFEVGRLPWIALCLAGSFACYGLVKKHVGSAVDALTGMTLEACILAPVAAIYLAWLTSHGGLTFGHGVGHSTLLAASGVVTVVPLLLFAAAARRLPLSTVGLLQYLAPTFQFMIGVLVQHEPMTRGRWMGFGLIWLALIVLTTDSLRHSRRPAVDPVEV